MAEKRLVKNALGSCAAFIALGRHEVGGFAAFKRLHIVDQLIDQRLDRLATCPCDVWRQDEIRQVEQAHESMIAFWRLGGDDVKPGAADQSLRRAFSSAASSTNPPRAVLISSGRCVMSANSAEEIMLRVEGISGECYVMMSLTRKTSSKGV